VAVNGHGKRRAAVTQTLLDYFGMDALLEQMGSVAVAQVVKANPRQASPLRNAAEVALGDVASMKRPAVGLAKDKSMIFVGVAENPTVFVLSIVKGAEL